MTILTTDVTIITKIQVTTNLIDTTPAYATPFELCMTFTQTTLTHTSWQWLILIIAGVQHFWPWPTLIIPLNHIIHGIVFNCLWHCLLLFIILSYIYWLTITRKKTLVIVFSRVFWKQTQSRLFRPPTDKQLTISDSLIKHLLLRGG